MRKKYIVISDASPIISLAVIQKLDILTKLFDKVYIPNAVWEELVEAKLTEDIAQIKPFFRDKVMRLKSLNYLFPFVDYGESEAILLCKEINADFLIIDDKKARQIAELIGVECVGTIGVLFEAKQKGFIKELRPLFVKLIKNKRYYSKAILNSVLIKAGETAI